MLFVEWTPDLSVGDDTNDAQHQSLFEKMNRLQKAVKEGDDNVVTITVLRELAEYAKSHFEDEEALMERIGYPDLDRHRREHSTFVQEVVQSAIKWSGGDKAAAQEILDFIKVWTLEHIMVEDKKIQPYVIKAKAAQAS